MPRLPTSLGPAALCALLLAACGGAPDPGSPAFLATASPTASAVIVARGVFDCFPAGLVDDDGDILTCETSAVAKSGPELIIANDKPVPGPGRSALFAMDGDEHGVDAGSLRYLTAPEVLSARKFEAMTVTPDQHTILASTAFDRIKPDSATWDAYNVLLAWPAGAEDRVRIVAESSREGIVSSRAIRTKIAEALRSEAFPQGAPYFKVEGLAALPDGRLLFGIREIGNSYKDFDYTLTIVSVPYKAGEGGMVLGSDFVPIYRFDTTTVEELGGTRVGLSSFEYDPFHDRLYLLTSYEREETDEGLGGYLWLLPLADLEAGRPPRLVRQTDGRPIAFAHKPEGLAVIDREHVFVVHDDDRVLGRDKVENAETQFQRLPHQAAYTIVRFK